MVLQIGTGRASSSSSSSSLITKHHPLPRCLQQHWWQLFDHIQIFFSRVGRWGLFTVALAEGVLDVERANLVEAVTLNIVAIGSHCTRWSRIRWAFRSCQTFWSHGTHNLVDCKCTTKTPKHRLSNMDAAFGMLARLDLAFETDAGVLSRSTASNWRPHSTISI